ncbi:MAG: system potassium uptake protein [Solirubrobacterales bacterium]|jgi:KUP system potassium uptake protein|nr:system potassium uptake protein [Solirubrobacterales bacterium]
MLQPGTRAPAKLALTVGALGVVFGDIGTSPLYTVSTVFNPNDPHPVRQSMDSVFGVVSLIFWAVTLIVTVKYVLFVMRADNQGEGGILALLSLIRRKTAGSARVKGGLAALGVFGAALFFGDSMITPAISVLSAVEGLKVVQPSLGHLVVPLTAAIVVFLFAVQRFGTAAVGRMFGPVMIVWFTTIALLGVRGIVMSPEILKVLSPSYAFDFLVHHGATGFFSLAAVVLAITGAEALYADMGHFGRPAITRAWLLLVFPALVLCYLGQGGLLLDNPGGSITSPFFQLVPAWGQWPMVFLATIATVIASQAVISGAFSVANQAVQLGYLPRLRIIHTSAQEYGQIYVPWINWALMAAVLTLVFAFQTSARLAFAYGVAVTGTIAITTVLFFWIVRRDWGRPLWVALLGAGFFLTIELAFLAANLTKLFHGAWVPLLVGAAVFTVMTTWARGREMVSKERLRAEGPLEAWVKQLRSKKPPVVRVPGTAVFLNRGKETAPLAMRANVDHNHALHEHVIVLSLETLPVPRVAPAERFEIDHLGYKDDGITFVAARLGYLEEPNVPALLRSIARKGFEPGADPREASYFLSKVEIKRGSAKGMSRWRKELFLITASIAAEPADYFRLPLGRTVIMGSQIQL